MKMQNLIAGLLAVTSLTAALFPLSVEARSYRTKASDVYVRGYYKKDGTYVRPYYRSQPDGIVWNNYSCIDNGKCGNYSGSSSYSRPTNTTPSYSDAPTEAQENVVSEPAISYSVGDLIKICVSRFGKGATFDSGIGCVCDKGYKVNATKDACLPLVSVTEKKQHRIKTYADGSQLDLDTMEVIR